MFIIWLASSAECPHCPRLDSFRFRFRGSVGGGSGSGGYRESVDAKVRK